MSSAFYNKGEICSAGSRLLLERSIHDAVVDGLVNYVSQIKMGNPLDPDVLFGPLADAEQLKKDAVRGVWQAGWRNFTLWWERFYPDGTDGKGYYFQPTIFTNASNEMRIAQEEIFGPVLTVIPFDTEAEAIRIANGTNYGLASGVHTATLRKLRVANAMQQEPAGSIATTFMMFLCHLEATKHLVSRECGRSDGELYAYQIYLIDLS